MYIGLHWMGAHASVFYFCLIIVGWKIQIRLHR